MLDPIILYLPHLVLVRTIDNILTCIEPSALYLDLDTQIYRSNKTLPARPHPGVFIVRTILYCHVQAMQPSCFHSTMDLSLTST